MIGDEYSLTLLFRRSVGGMTFNVGYAAIRAWRDFITSDLQGTLERTSPRDCMDRDNLSRATTIALLS